MPKRKIYSYKRRKGQKPTLFRMLFTYLNHGIAINT